MSYNNNCVVIEMELFDVGDHLLSKMSFFQRHFLYYLLPNYRVGVIESYYLCYVFGITKPKTRSVHAFYFWEQLFVYMCASNLRVCGSKNYKR